MLIVDINTLETVYTLYLAEHIVLCGAQALDLQDVMRVHATFCKLVSGLQDIAVLDLDAGSVRDKVCFRLACLVICNDDLAFLLGIADGRFSGELCDDRKSLRLSGLEKLLDTGKTLCDIVAGHTAGMERTHGQLGTRLTDGLCRDDSDCLAYLYHFAGRHVRAVALRADAVLAAAGKDRTDLHFLQRLTVLIHTFLHHALCTAGCDHVILLHKDVAVLIFDILAGYTSCDTVLQALDLFIAVRERMYIHARDLLIRSHTVCIVDDQLL